MNPSAGRTDLPDFESGPFSRLGTSPYKIFIKKKKKTKLRENCEMSKSENANKGSKNRLEMRFLDKKNEIQNYVSSADPSATWVHLHIC